MTQHKQIEHENRDSNRPEFRNYNFHFTSKEMKNNTPYKFTMENNNETKHTPGPWTYRRTHEMSSDHWYVIVDGNGKGPIVDVGGRDLSGQIAEAKYLVTDPKEIEANASLIASAPDLLKENQELKRELDLFKRTTEPYVTLAKENQELKARILELEDEIKVLQQFDER